MAAVADFMTELTRLNDLVAQWNADQLLLALTNIQQIRRGFRMNILLVGSWVPVKQQLAKKIGP